MTNKSGKKAGLPPGSLVYVGDKKEKGRVGITLFDYSEQSFTEKKYTEIEECLDSLKEKRYVKWLNINGLHDIGIIEKIGSRFNLHPLTQEDILNTEQRPKVEEYPEYIYIVLKMIYPDVGDDLFYEQVSIILGTDYVITFQEKEGDVFDPVRHRIRTANGRMRTMGADYLAYLLMDTLVDNYFIILESFGQKIEDIEEKLLTNPEIVTLHKIHNLKWDLLFMRKSLWPLREAINNLIRSEAAFVRKPTFLYLRDLYDHTIRVVDIIETLRDITSGMLEIYLSSISNKMNEVMKVLTIIATIFIPLTLVAGIYGMNFEFMPELHIKWAYPLVLLFMLGVGIAMLFYFKKKKWL
jgi:magnesium transporter